MTPTNTQGSEQELRERIQKAHDTLHGRQSTHVQVSKHSGWSNADLERVLDEDMMLFENELLALIKSDREAAEVRSLLTLRRLYDRYEMEYRRDFEGNEIATWSGYKFFRNPISDRIEEITGVRSDQEVEAWLAQLSKEPKS